MLKRLSQHRVYAALALSCLALAVSATASALVRTAPTQPVSPTGGITVAPALLTAQIGSKQSQVSATIGVRNNFEVPVTVSAVLNGFDVRNNALVPTTTPEKSLARVVSLSPAEIVIAPGTSKNVGVQVHDSADLAPGGHYLSILLTETAVNDTHESSQLALRPAVSATLYVIKEDGAVRNLKAQAIRFKHSLFSLPKTADISFYNDGNVPSVPRGVVQLSHGPRNEMIFAQGVVNPQSAPLYPQSAITLQTQLQTTAGVWLPGRYQALLQYRYDGQEATKTLVSTYWYIPKLFVGVIGLVIAVVSLCLWPENQRRILRSWHRAHLPRRPAFVAPDPTKIKQQAGGALVPKKQSTVGRRNIDDIHKVL